MGGGATASVGSMGGGGTASVGSMGGATATARVSWEAERPFYKG